MGELRKQRRLRVSRHADDLLLDHAEEHDGCVLSRDRFLDKRRDRLWVPERFFSWVSTGSGVRIARRVSLNTQSFDISRKQEQKLAAARGIANLDHPLARRRWVCASDLPCAAREVSPSILRAIPVLDGERALCPGCGQPANDLGPRQGEAELKLRVDEKTVIRFSLRQGETIAFGRLTLPESAALSELGRGGALAELGRIHVELRVAGKRVAVRPLGEGRRVWVREWDAGRRRYRRERELSPEKGFVAIGIRDTLSLGRRLELVRSGRSLAEAGLLGGPGS